VPRITLADGVFDPLHAGHVTYLVLAGHRTSDNDRLIVQVSPQRKRAECIPWDLRASVVRALKGVHEVVQYPTTADAIRVIRPARYVKGGDWRGRALPEADLCRELGVEVCYVDTPRQDSSTTRLEAWAARTAAAGLDELQERAQAQVAVPFDAIAQGYTYEARVVAEGEHPRILAGLCRGKTVLDVGCGPGHFVRMLREAGADIDGIDPAGQGSLSGQVEYVPGRAYAVAVCREVLEHLPVRALGPFIGHLFRLARERVYITTRFTGSPRHSFALATEYEADPSHITLLPQPLVRALCVLHGGVRDPEWEAALDHQRKGRVLVYTVGA
jgi:glycerol-3-phosphate cytidylyltransferase-like family protein